jgi:hypothetical protein
MNCVRWRVLSAYAVLAALAVLLLDLWNWSSTGPLMFGWMPVGLWWPAAATLLCVPGLAYAFSVIWPDASPDEPDEPGASRPGEVRRSRQA